MVFNLFVQIILNVGFIQYVSLGCFYSRHFELLNLEYIH